MYRYSKKTNASSLYGGDSSSLDSFAEGVKALLLSDIHFFHAYSQRSYLDLDGQIGVSSVLRFESLQKDFDAFIAENGLHHLKQTLPHDNGTSTGLKQGNSASCSPAAKAIVEEIWSEDFEAFGY